MKRHLLFAAALLLASPIASQAFTPENGWYVPITGDNSGAKGGTGLAIEIQDHYLFAIGFIYGQNGMPIWVAMEGSMQQQSDGSWGLSSSTNLYTKENGQCLGNTATCPYKAPATVNVGSFSINFPAENIGTLSWGPSGNVESATLLRFNYNLGKSPQSMQGRWDVVINHQAGANVDGVQYDGDRLRINSVTANSDGTYAVNGCVENSEEASTQVCDTSANSFAVKGTAKPSGFGYQYQLAAYTFGTSTFTPKILRVYNFAENGLGGPFSNYIHGTVNICGAGVSSIGQCTTVKNSPFNAYRSASAHYAKSGSGMDQTPGG